MLSIIDERTPKIDRKSVSIAIWRQMASQWGDKWQSKTLFFIFDPCSSIVDNVFDCRLPSVRIYYIFKREYIKNQQEKGKIYFVWLKFVRRHLLDVV